MGHIYVDFLKNLSMPQLLGVAGDLGIDSEKSQLTFILKHLYDLFIERDADIVQINPLILTNDNKLFANHAKIKIDINSHFRQ
jgi:succinyl-CoA synthetase beta subunit